VDFTTGTTAVIVADASGGTTEVTYNGAPLISGVDFLCGDVVEIRVINLGAQQDAGGGNYAIRVQVYPGR
jgi:hypothetical protein